MGARIHLKFVKIKSIRRFIPSIAGVCLMVYGMGRLPAIHLFVYLRGCPGRMLSHLVFICYTSCTGNQTDAVVAGRGFVKARAYDSCVTKVFGVVFADVCPLFSHVPLSVLLCSL
jgi:hypothetical protein